MEQIDDSGDIHPVGQIIFVGKIGDPCLGVRSYGALTDRNRAGCGNQEPAGQSRVVLPLPLGPKRPMMCPGSIVRFTS